MFSYSRRDKILFIYVVLLSMLCQLTLALYFFEAEKDVYFDFYSSKSDGGPVDPTQDCQKVRFKDGQIEIPSSYDVHKQTFMYIHGYLSTPRAQKQHVASFFENVATGHFCCNFIVLKWTNGNLNLIYALMMERSENVAEMGYRLVRELRVKKGLVLENFTMVGHSIGAHIAAMISRKFINHKLKLIESRRMKERNAFILAEGQTEFEKYTYRLNVRKRQQAKEMNASETHGNIFYHADYLEIIVDDIDFGLIGIIIGVDPAGPSYRNEREEVLRRSLRPRLAIYSSVIHTNAGIYGLEKLSADADFFPDSGIYQPFCTPKPYIRRIAICSHKSAARMYWRTLKYKFIAIRCDDHESILEFSICNQSISTPEWVYMGENLVYVPFQQRPRGIFYTEASGKHCNDINPIPISNSLSLAHKINALHKHVPSFKNVCIIRNGKVTHRGENWLLPTVKERAKLIAEKTYLMELMVRLENGEAGDEIVEDNEE